ncbi:hypothetical protein F5X96DRAFT_657630 [Biscogniauxia mediterranea]|nr:hypothetical protein F5X96DRAFT_657630 [Biscogniauxia mediterranea]
MQPPLSMQPDEAFHAIKMDPIADLLLFSDTETLLDDESLLNSPGSGSEASDPLISTKTDDPLAHFADAVWETFAEVDHALKCACEEAGFGVAIRRSENYSKSLGDYARKRYECYKGKEKLLTLFGKRKVAKTVRENCLWAGVLTYYNEKKNQQAGWRFKYVKDFKHHTHQMLSRPSFIPSNRRNHLTLEVIQAIEAAAMKPKNTASDIVEEVICLFSNADVDRKAVVNILAKSRKVRFGDRTAT